MREVTGELIINGRAMPIKATRYLIGRGEGCNILLAEDDLGASRRHAVIEQSPQGDWTVEDLGSRNGTLVNGQRITEPRLLRDGDTVTIGKVVIQLSAPRSRQTLYMPPTERPDEADLTRAESTRDPKTEFIRIPAPNSSAPADAAPPAVQSMGPPTLHSMTSPSTTPRDPKTEFITAPSTVAGQVTNATAPRDPKTEFIRTDVLSERQPAAREEPPPSAPPAYEEAPRAPKTVFLRAGDPQASPPAEPGFGPAAFAGPPAPADAPPRDPRTEFIQMPPPLPSVEAPASAQDTEAPPPASSWPADRDPAAPPTTGWASPDQELAAPPTTGWAAARVQDPAWPLPADGPASTGADAAAASPAGWTAQPNPSLAAPPTAAWPAPTARENDPKTEFIRLPDLLAQPDAPSAEISEATDAYPVEAASPASPRDRTPVADEATESWSVQAVPAAVPPPLPPATWEPAPTAPPAATMEPSVAPAPAGTMEPASSPGRAMPSQAASAEPATLRGGMADSGGAAGPRPEPPIAEAGKQTMPGAPARGSGMPATMPEIAAFLFGAGAGSLRAPFASMWDTDTPPTPPTPRSDRKELPSAEPRATAEAPGATGSDGDTK